MAGGIERIPDSLGHLVISQDGAVISSGGDLENDEKTANTLLSIIHTSLKIPMSHDRPANLKRVSVIWEDFLYVMTVSNHRVYAVKRQNIPQEAVNA